MDRKSFAILLVSLVVLMAWMQLANRLFPPVPIPEPEATLVQTNAPGPSTEAPSAAPRPPPVLTAAPQLPALPEPEQAEEVVTLENDDALFTFTSHGGGLKLLELKDYPEKVGRRARRSQSTNNLASLNTRAPVPAFALLGSPELQGNGLFQLTPTNNGLLAEQDLPSGVRITKEFIPGTNFLFSVRLRLENRGSAAVELPVQEWVVGTATPMDPYDKAYLMGTIWYDGAKAHPVSDAWFANRTLGCLPGTPRTEYVAGASNVVWAGVHNRFFALVTVPGAEAPAPRLVSRRVDLPAPSAEELAADKRLIAKPVGFQTAFLYPALELEPGEAAERQYVIYAGPKEYRTLDRLGQRLGTRLDLVMQFGWFGFFAKALLLSMNGLHGIGLSYGLAIIAITIIIKLLFWPLTQASTRSMKRMQTLQPQMKALQAKYKDDPQKMNRKMMEFMKENKVNPAAGCLPILIQLPIFIGFYQMLQSAIELRGAGFLWAADLSQPDTIFFLPYLGFPVNPLPLIMGATQLWQTRLTPATPGADPVQQKMMQYMPLIFLFILYNFSSGLTLYWTVQNLLTIAQMKLTRTIDAKTASAAKTTAPAHPSPRPKPGKP